MQAIRDAPLVVRNCIWEELCVDQHKSLRHMVLSFLVALQHVMKSSSQTKPAWIAKWLCKQSPVNPKPFAFKVDCARAGGCQVVNSQGPSLDLSHVRNILRRSVTHGHCMVRGWSEFLVCTGAAVYLADDFPEEKLADRLADQGVRSMFFQFSGSDAWMGFVSSIVHFHIFSWLSWHLLSCRLEGSTKREVESNPGCCNQMFCSQSLCIPRALESQMKSLLRVNLDPERLLDFLLDVLPQARDWAYWAGRNRSSCRCRCHFGRYCFDRILLWSISKVSQCSIREWDSWWLLLVTRFCLEWCSWVCWAEFKDVGQGAECWTCGRDAGGARNLK